jgi:hypothetical protein
MIEWFSISADTIIRGFYNSTLILPPAENSADFVTNLLAVIAGGMITLAANYLQDGRQNQNAEKIREKEEERRLVQLRNEAYIGLFSVLHFYQNTPGDLRNNQTFSENISKVFAYGSQEIKELLNKLNQNINMQIETTDETEIKNHRDEVKGQILKLETLISNQLILNIK